MAIRRARLTVVKPGAGRTKSQVSRRSMELSSSAPCCLSFAAGTAAATPTRSGLTEGYTFHKAGQKSQFPGFVRAHAHGVLALVSQGRDVKILLLGGGSCPLRSGRLLFFSFCVISLNYRKSDQGPFLDAKLQETKFKRPFTASYLASFILQLNTAARAAQIIANQESTITMSQKHLLFI